MRRKGEINEADKLETATRYPGCIYHWIDRQSLGKADPAENPAGVPGKGLRSDRSHLTDPGGSRDHFYYRKSIFQRGGLRDEGEFKQASG